MNDNFSFFKYFGPMIIRLRFDYDLTYKVQIGISYQLFSNHALILSPNRDR